MRSTRLLASALGLVALPALASAIPYSVTIENLVVPAGPAMGQPFTPPVVIVHDAGYSMFTLGSPATPGLEALAEDAMTDPLVGEANASPNVSLVDVGGGPFFDSVTVMFEAEPGSRLSIATMLARSNDLFTGVNGVVLPAAGVSVVQANAYDAGTEVNTGLVAHIPFYGNVGVGDTENGNVSMIGAYQVVDDPDHGVLSFTFPPTAVVTIVAETPAPVDESSWGSVKNLYR